MSRILALPALALALSACNRDDNELDKLERRVAALEEGSVIGSTDDSPGWDGEEPSTAVEELEERVEDVEEGAEAVDGLVEDLDALTARLEALEADVAAIEPGTRVSTRTASDSSGLGGDTAEWETLGGATVDLSSDAPDHLMAFCRASGRESGVTRVRVALLSSGGDVLEVSSEGVPMRTAEDEEAFLAQWSGAPAEGVVRVSCQGRYAQLFTYAELSVLVAE